MPKDIEDVLRDWWNRKGGDISEWPDVAESILIALRKAGYIILPIAVVPNSLIDEKTKRLGKKIHGLL